MDRNIKMEIELPEEQLENFRIFIVLHGGAIVKEDKIGNNIRNNRWIPVSERLPEDYIHVLCQFTLGGMGECYLAHGVFHVVGGLVMTCNEVIAWMPLPEPYKEDEN